MGGKYTIYEDTYEIKPKEILFPEDEDSDFKSEWVDDCKFRIVVSPGKISFHKQTLTYACYSSPWVGFEEVSMLVFLLFLDYQSQGICLEITWGWEGRVHSCSNIQRVDPVIIDFWLEGFCLTCHDRLLAGRFLSHNSFSPAD